MIAIVSPDRPPAWRALPRGRAFSAPFLELRAAALEWMADYYDREHLTRAADWALALAPDAPEPLVLAALTHDLERAVPGGPVLDKATMAWDDPVYNRAHCDRSAEVVSAWLRDRASPEGWPDAVRQPIREHEFGGSDAGDLMQAVDSISFLETNSGLAARWVLGGECSLSKARAKLHWMCDRVRLPEGRPLARSQYNRAMVELDHRLAEAA